ncbi:hypothetical protein LCGC14_0320540 [marine sediment metagenome]|uniref:Gp5/Type VI secretion system Vgr protein OB-fold domain-containing protein n=1 Tax=marine sediment metagenome TaxID=412755 RepID=A0A0F9W6Z5_9ZZZZ
MHQVVERGIVTSNEDPAKVGRIKVALATVDGNEYPEWIEPVFDPGWFTPPEPGAAVDLVLPEGTDLVEFAHEIRYLGSVFEEGNGPPAAFKATGLKPTRRGYFTKAGHLLLFEDAAGKEEIFLSHKGNMLIALTNTGIFLGTKNATENFVLGKILKSIMESILDAIVAHAHTETGTVTSPPINAAVFTAIKATLSTMLSDFIFGQKVKP